ncbi:enterochelin esterase [Ktedonobacter racemifer]|uniref:Putative esterase n=1 Tax=Ktedonobacter racemifer DSM 44963 TaxID=485913 RepID=D6U4I8_KTERA|nr:enterochelin esterase [Ktedonobacter racemifer]EFH81418.1 putative esterase [Ktedonobacter racemifer DSM 44963]
MTDKKEYTSPRIASLKEALSSGDNAALESFWQEIAEHGAPLMERIEDDPEHYLVTFLWRDEGDTQNVVVFSGPAGFTDPAKNQMQRLLESDLWYRSYRVRSNLRQTYMLSHNDPLTDLDWKADLGTRLVADPLNPQIFAFPKDEDSQNDHGFTISVLELPEAPPQPYITPRPDVPKGRVEKHRVHSEILNNERRVYIYTPPGYDSESEPYALLLLFDGPAYIEMVPTPTILDNLISEGKIPPMIAVLPDSLDGETRSRELPCHQPFVDFLKQELLPWVRERYHITDDPARSIVGGSSYGGLASSFVGLRASEYFGNVLSQSGSYWWESDPEDGIPQESLTQQFIESPRLPVRFYMEVGLQERNASDTSMIITNRHLRDILRLKGYEVHYTEFNGGHDYLCWRGTLSDGLTTLAGQFISKL